MMGDIGVVSKKSLHYRDHHQYTEPDARKIVEEFRLSHCDFLVTTTKDLVKLRHLIADPKMLWGANLTLQELSQKGRLHEIISQLLR